MDTIEQIKFRLNEMRSEMNGLNRRRDALLEAISQLGWALDLLMDAPPMTAPAPKPRQPRGAVEAAVLKGLDGGFYCTIEDLVAATQQKPNSIRAALKTLVKEGKAFEAAPGKFTNAKPSKPRSTEATPTEPPNGSEPPARFSEDEIARHMPGG